MPGGGGPGPADVPVDRREVKDAWDRFNWLWEILFAVAYAATTTLVVL